MIHEIKRKGGAEMSVGNNIKLYLDKNGISQTFLSEKTGIKDNTLSNMLNGKRRILVEEYFMICEVLGKPYEFFKSVA